MSHHDSTASRAQQLLNRIEQIALVELAFDDIGLRADLEAAAPGFPVFRIVPS